MRHQQSDETVQRACTSRNTDIGIDIDIDPDRAAAELSIEQLLSD